MLLLHTAGTIKIGDVRRYTLNYTPDRDRILPLPKALYLRIKNTSSVPLRAAYLQGPYTLYVSVKRQEFQPWPSDTPGTDEREAELRNEPDRAEEGYEGGVPQFEPNLKAGASFYATLPIPEDLLEGSLTSFQQGPREATANTRHDYEHGGNVSLDGKRHFVEQSKKRKSVTWVIEVVSQVIFTTKATVGYEVLIARDEQSLSYAYPYGPENARPSSSGSEDYSSEIRSPSIEMKFQDTVDLWNTLPFPTFEDQITAEERSRDPQEQDEAREMRWKQRVKRKPKKVHLVILTHGMHSNTSADMLFMKEAIDEEEHKAALVRRKKGEREMAEGKLPADYVDEEEEQVIVRGYRHNACNTERGIKWLGRRLAKYILNLVSPAEYPPPPKQGQMKLQKK